MLVNAVMYVFPDDQVDEAARLLAELRRASLAEPGCLGYDIARANDEPAFVLFEKWRDQTALDEHYATEHFQRLGINGIRTLALNRQAIRGSLVE